MKTTVEIDDDLLKAAKKRSIDDGTTLGRFIELAIAERLTGTGPAGIYGHFGSRAELYDEAAFEWLEEFAAKSKARAS